MKICLIASHTSIHTLRWVEFLKKAGNEVHLIAFSPAEIKDATVHSLNAKFSFSPLSKIFTPLPTLLELRFIPKIKKILKKIKPDILHGHYLTCYAFFAAASGFHPLVVSAWGSDIATDPDKHWFLKLIVKYVLKQADLVHVGDEPAKRRALELGCGAQKIFIQPWGIDISRFSPDKQSISLKNELDIINNYSVINTNALDNEKYHIDILIRAIPFILKKIKNIKFILAASGPSELDIKELIQQLKLQNYVIFLGGVPNQEMPALLSVTDLYVDTFFPVNNKGGNGVGIATMEAMASGIPQIMPKTPNITDPANHWFCGVFYRIGSPEDLAEKIIYLLKDKNLRKKIGEKSRKVALELFDLDKNMDDWQMVYNNLTRKSI